MPGWGSLVRRLLEHLRAESLVAHQSTLADSSPSSVESVDHWELVGGSEPIAEGQHSSVPVTSAEPVLPVALEPWWLHPAEQRLPSSLTLAAGRRVECDVSGLQCLELAFDRGCQALRILQGELGSFLPGELKDQNFLVDQNKLVLPIFTSKKRFLDMQLRPFV